MRRRAFTLLDVLLETSGKPQATVLLVMGLVSLIGSVSLYVTMGAYQKSALQTEKNTFTSLLQRARSLSMNNVCAGECTDGVAHGVHIDDEGYVLFQGSEYVDSDPHNARFPFEPTLVRAGTLLTQDVVFAQLSGDTNCSSVCELSIRAPDGVTVVISVTGEGRILWTM